MMHQPTDGKPTARFFFFFLLEKYERYVQLYEKVRKLATRDHNSYLSVVPEFSVPGGVSVRFNPGTAETIGNVVLKRYKKLTEKTKVSHPEIPEKLFEIKKKIQKDGGAFFLLTS